MRTYSGLSLEPSDVLNYDGSNDILTDNIDRNEKKILVCVTSRNGAGITFPAVATAQLLFCLFGDNLQTIGN